MRGLYISFVIKRRKKADKIADYFLALAIFMFVFVFAFYLQFIQKENKYNSSYKNLQAKNAESAALKKKIDAKQVENASDFEKNYNTAYDELAQCVEYANGYTEYISDIYSTISKNNLKGITITGIKADTKNSEIELSLYFDLASDGEIDHRYRTALLDCDWIPKDGIKYTDTNSSTTWHIQVNSTLPIAGGEE